jgi:hypothetical protein
MRENKMVRMCNVQALDITSSGLVEICSVLRQTMIRIHTVLMGCRVRNKSTFEATLRGKTVICTPRVRVLYFPTPSVDFRSTILQLGKASSWEGTQGGELRELWLLYPKVLVVLCLPFNSESPTNHNYYPRTIFDHQRHMQKSPRTGPVDI